MKNSPFDFDQLRLTPASIEDYPTIQNLARFYVYDMSEYCGFLPDWEFPQNGLYDCIDFKHYWLEPDTFPFLIHYKDELAGFVIINKKGCEPSTDFNMAQFFIARKFKHHGVGRFIAELCFKKFLGTWEVMVIPQNKGAHHFWKKVITNYTNSLFTEEVKRVLHFDNKEKIIFTFSSATKSR